MEESIPRKRVVKNTKVIKFIKVASPGPVIDYLFESLSSRLRKGQKVLWLLPGGSAINIAVDVAEKLRNTPLMNLTATLYDERFGKPGHTDSNWHQLMKAGLFLPGATLQPILKGNDIEGTTRDFAQTLENDLSDSDYRMGFFGVGPDGHISGILPGSPAVHTQEMVFWYQAHDFMRITSTFNFIRELDEIIVYAAGESKHQTLDNLDNDLSLDEQPAQILKELQRVIIFNDYKGEGP